MSMLQCAPAAELAGWISDGGHPLVVGEDGTLEGFEPSIAGVEPCEVTLSDGYESYSWAPDTVLYYIA